MNHLKMAFLLKGAHYIRYVLKFICDKFVCHQDSISYDEYGLCNAWMIKLKNPYFDKNLNYITNRLNNILKTPI